MSSHQSLTSQTKAKLIWLPESFFTEALAKFQNLVELKAVLCAAYLVQQNNFEFVTYQQLRSFGPLAAVGDEVLQEALSLAVQDGLLLRSVSQIEGISQDIYSLPKDIYKPSATNIFCLYEQNIGIITPIIGEELKEAANLYPPQWIEEAFREAAMLNKRSWRYVVRILERWASEGKDSGKYQGNIKKDSPDKYIKGKYGRLVRR